MTPRPGVGVVGTGRVGAVLGAALRRVGYPIVACTANSDLSRVRAEALLPGVAIRSAREVVRLADLVLLTVPDDALAATAVDLAPQVRRGQFVAHASGRHGLAVLDPMTLAGARPMAVHPAMTFTGTSLDLDRLIDCPFGVTATESVRPIAAALVIELGGDPIWVDEEARVLYHAALAHGANHLVTLVAQTMDLLSDAGVEDPARLAGPLLRAALDNALREGDLALTGPVARGDAQTVRAHLAAVPDDTVEAYRAMARATADRAVASGLLAAAEGIHEALEPEES